MNETKQEATRVPNTIRRRVSPTRTSKAVAVVTVLSVLGIASNVSAAAGRLDKSFSQDGKATAALIDEYHIGRDVVVQDNGRVLLVGESFNQVAAARFRTDGTPDDSFGQGGTTTLDFPGDNEAYGGRVVLDGQGRALVGAYVYDLNSGNFDFGLARLLTNGTPDDTFSGDGFAVLDTPDIDETLMGIARAPGGKVVLVGESYDDADSTYKVGVARFTSEGEPDDSFGGGSGFVMHTFNGAIQGGAARSVLVRDNGKILLGIYPNQFGDSDFVLGELNENGTVSSGFAVGGIRVTDFKGNNDRVTTMAWQGSKIIMAGYADTAVGNQDWALARYKSNGALDQTFSGDGRVMTHIRTDHSDEIYDIKVQGDDRIVAVGRYTESGNMTIGRYKPNGGLDGSFSGDGLSFVEFPMSSRANAVDLRGDRIVVGGDARESTDTSTSFAVAVLQRT